jgi:hypothetical protein
VLGCENFPNERGQMADRLERREFCEVIGVFPLLTMQVAGEQGTEHVQVAPDKAQSGRMLTAFTPAGKIEAYFRNGHGFDAKSFSEYGMELVGPALTLEEATRV